MSKNTSLITTFVVAVLIGVGIFIFSPGSKYNPFTKPVSVLAEKLKPSDCTQYEKYDADDESCYFECDTDTECADLAAKVEKEVNDKYNTVTYQKPSPKSTSSVESRSSQATSAIALSSSTTSSIADSKSLASSVSDIASSVSATQEQQASIATAQAPAEDRQSYSVISGNVTPDIALKQKKDIWNYFVNIAGNQFVNENIVKLTFNNSPEDTTMASVNQNTEDNTKWDLSVNLAYADNKTQLIYTLVHEYTHILSLNKTKVDVNNQGECGALKLSEGCALVDSPINKFYQTYWAALGADANTNNFGQYYGANPDNFVSEYAGTNVIEDFAETFTTFVLKNTSSLPAGAQAKVAFLASLPELKSRSVQIIAAVGTESNLK